MSTYLYKAVNAQGRLSEGRLDASDKKVAISQLEKLGLIPVSLEEPLSTRPATFAKFQLRSVSRRDILFFTEELATLIHAGLPLDRTLTIITDTVRKPALRA